MVKNRGIRIKSSMLGIFAAVVMAFVMIAIATQTSFAEQSWKVTNDGQEYVLTDGEVILTAEHNYEGSEEIGYSWFEKSPQYSLWIPNVGFEKTFVARRAGEYKCVVSIADEVYEAVYTVGYSWKITNSPQWTYVKNGAGVATVHVETNYTGNKTVSYQWYRGGLIGGIPDASKKIEGATKATYSTTTMDFERVQFSLCCEVSIGGETQYGRYLCDSFFVDDCDESYEVQLGNLNCELARFSGEDDVHIWFYKNDPQGSIFLPDRVTLENGKTYTIAGLDRLYGMANVTQITIPETVREIAPLSMGYYGTNDTGIRQYIKVPGFTIIGKIGSAAHQYALDNGFNFKELDNQGEQGSGQGSGNGDTNTDPNTNTPVVNNPVTQPESIKTVTVNSNTVNASSIRKAITEAGGSPEHIKTFVLGKNVKKISKKAFAGFGSITTLEVRTKKLKAKSVKDALKGSNIKTVKVNVGKKKDNKKFIKNYKKIFTKKNAGKKVKIK